MTENNTQRPAFEPLKAIGLFLACFGLAVMGAALLDMPLQDKVINLIAGSVVLAIGAGAFLLGWKRSKKDT
ncbi:MAG TPA: hypothetical protein VM658_02645 [bacterium]|nr:hypothetical protein [bacterium]